MLKKVVSSLACVAVMMTISNTSHAISGSVHDSFPMVGGCYGGDQDWWADDDERKKRMTGCAPTAGANIFAFLAKNNHIKGIFKDTNNIGKVEYFGLMNRIYEEMIPANSLMRFVGVSSSAYFAKSMKKIAAGYNIDLEYRKMELSGKTPEDVEKFAKFIETGGLDSSRPVVLFIGNAVNNRSGKYTEADIHKNMGKNFRGHAVTVTDCRQNERGERFIRVSSWGCEYELNLNALAERRANLEAVYFVLSDNQKAELKVAN